MAVLMFLVLCLGHVAHVQATETCAVGGPEAFVSGDVISRQQDITALQCGESLCSLAAELELRRATVPTLQDTDDTMVATDRDQLRYRYATQQFHAAKESDFRPQGTTAVVIPLVTGARGLDIHVQPVTGLVEVAYTDPTNTDIGLAHCLTVDCSTLSTSPTVDSDDQVPRVQLMSRVYYDSAAGSVLVYATDSGLVLTQHCDDLECSVLYKTTIDSGGVGPGGACLTGTILYDRTEDRSILLTLYRSTSGALELRRLTEDANGHFEVPLSNVTFSVVTDFELPAGDPSCISRPQLLPDGRVAFTVSDVRTPSVPEVWGVFCDHVAENCTISSVPYLTNGTAGSWWSELVLQVLPDSGTLVTGAVDLMAEELSLRWCAGVSASVDDCGTETPRATRLIPDADLASATVTRSGHVQVLTRHTAGATESLQLHWGFDSESSLEVGLLAGADVRHFAVALTTAADGRPVLVYCDDASTDVVVTRCGNEFCMPFQDPL